MRRSFPHHRSRSLRATRTIFPPPQIPVPPCDDLSAAPEANQGEICFRGRNIMMGYMANPDLGQEHVDEINKKTAETLHPDGWLMSGDKATMDKAGMFRITGRYKELIITAGGENVAPVPIEDWIKVGSGRFHLRKRRRKRIRRSVGRFSLEVGVPGTRR